MEIFSNEKATPLTFFSSLLKILLKINTYFKKILIFALSKLIKPT